LTINNSQYRILLGAHPVINQKTTRDKKKSEFLPSLLLHLVAAPSQGRFVNLHPANMRDAVHRGGNGA